MSKLSNIQHKIITSNDPRIGEWKKEGKSIVFTNGCFDIIHRGHIEYLAQTADYADKLVVAVNADSSVKKLNKGSSRPIQDENSRVIIIAALDFVDAVVLFDESTPYELISVIQPNVLVKGGDYDANITDKNNPKYIVGSDIVKASGGSVEVIQFVEGYSTSKIEAKIKNS